MEAGRQDLAAASALALRRARVVGATVVGAARRLEALRAAEPFAMARPCFFVVFFFFFPLRVFEVTVLDFGFININCVYLYF